MKKIMLSFLLLSVATISFGQNVPSYVPTNGLVGWWPFNGNANDESGNGNNGTVNGATLATDRFGNVGKAYDFDGVNDFIDVLNSASIQVGQAITVNVWIKTYFTSNQTPPQSLVRKGGSYTQSWTLNQEQGRYNFNVYNGTWNGITSPQSLLDSSRWSMLTGIFINDTIKILFDGVLQSSTIIQGPLTNTSDKLYFAVDPNDVLNGINPVYFKGKLDDIGIWNRALDSTEISNLFNGGSATSNTILRYDENVKIFPNPTNDHITIDAGNLNAMNGYSIRITNSLGQQMFQSAINQQQFYLDLTTWTGNGMYYVNIIDPNGNIIDIKKIVLQ